MEWWYIPIIVLLVVGVAYALFNGYGGAWLERRDHEKGTREPR